MGHSGGEGLGLLGAATPALDLEGKPLGGRDGVPRLSKPFLSGAPGSKAWDPVPGSG